MAVVVLEWGRDGVATEFYTYLTTLYAVVVVFLSRGGERERQTVIQCHLKNTSSSIQSKQSDPFLQQQDVEIQFRLEHFLEIKNYGAEYFNLQM